MCVDDAVWRQVTSSKRQLHRERVHPAGFYPEEACFYPCACDRSDDAGAPLAAAFRPPMSLLGPLVMAYQAVAPFRTINGYGLFAVMTKERREILVQGSDD